MTTGNERRGEWRLGRFRSEEIDPHKRYRHLFGLIDTYWNKSEEDTSCLYHYTKPHVVEALLKDGGDIGCAPIDKLDDHYEMEFGISGFLRYLADDCQWPRKYLHAIEERYATMNYAPLTASFCYKPDSAYQWKTYCPNPNGGMALGFRRNDLFAAVNRICATAPKPGDPDCNTAVFLPCFYEGVHDLKAVYRAWFSDNIRWFSKFRQSPLPDSREASLVLSTMMCASVCIKRNGFKDEHEFRIVKFRSRHGRELERIDAPKEMYKSGIANVTAGGFRSLAKLIAVGPYGDRDALNAKALSIGRKYGIQVVGSSLAPE